MTVEIYGASDDLIEVEGDIREEFGLPEGDQALLAFSDGTLLRIRYDDEGMWRITPLLADTETLVVRQATNPDDDYSDRAILKSQVRWVVLGVEHARSPKEGSGA